MPESISPHDEPTNGYLHDVARRAQKRRRAVDRSVAMVAGKYLLPTDLDQLRRCRGEINRLRHEDAGTHRLAATACKNERWCPWCVSEIHRKRTEFLVQRMSTVAPDKELRLLNIVFTLPLWLRDLVRQDGRALASFREAAWWTILECYGINNHRKQGSEFGAVMNLHAFGDEATPWPVWAPHLDVLLSGYRHTPDEVTRLPTRWPVSFEKTRDIYRRALRREFTPLARSFEQRVMLLEEFPVVLHVSMQQKGSPNVVLKGAQARHRVRYSARPLFELGRCRLEEAGEQDVLVYEPRGADLIHRVDPREAFGKLYRMRDHLAGGLVHQYYGLLSRHAYPKAARRAGHEPVAWRVKTGWKRVTTYRKDGAGIYYDTSARWAGFPRA